MKAIVSILLCSAIAIAIVYHWGSQRQRVKPNSQNTAELPAPPVSRDKAPGNPDTDFLPDLAMAQAKVEATSKLITEKMVPLLAQMPEELKRAQALIKTNDRLLVELAEWNAKRRFPVK